MSRLIFVNQKHAKHTYNATNSQTNDSFVILFGDVLFCFLFLNDHLAFSPQKPRIPRIIPGSVKKQNQIGTRAIKFFTISMPAVLVKRLNQASV